MGVTTFTETLSARRAVAMVATGSLLVPVTGAWKGTVTAPGVGVLALLLTVSLLVILGLLACADDDERVRALETPVLIVALFALVLEMAARLSGTPSYKNDDAGFLQAAAVAFTHGHNPYATNLDWAIRAYHFGVTQTTGGTHWTFFSYPAVSLLIAFVVVSLRSTIVAPTVVEVGALAIATVVLFRALPDRLRSLAPLVCVALPGLATHALNGLSEVMILPTLIVVAYRWRDVGRGGTLGRLGTVQAVALGLAVSTNQLTWFFVPFLVGGLFCMRRAELGPRVGGTVVARYAGIAALVTAVFNLPFIAWGPGSWFTDIFASFTRSAVPTGQGVPISLTLFAHVGGGDLQAFSYAFVLIYVALLAAYLRGFRRLHWLCFVLPVIALWFSGRALGSYWTVPIPFVLVSILNGGGKPALAPPGRVQADRRPHWLAPLATAALFIPGAVAIAIGLGTPAPLTMRLVAVPHRAEANAARQLEVAVTNRSSSPLVPHFQTSTSSHPSDFWRVRGGPRTLAPGATATYDLIAPRARADVRMPSSFSVDAVTAQPDTYSSASFTVAADRHAGGSNTGTGRAVSRPAATRGAG